MFLRVRSFPAWTKRWRATWRRSRLHCACSSKAGSSRHLDRRQDPRSTTPMRKSSVLLGAISLVVVFGATAWWKLRTEAENVAVPERLAADSARPPDAHSAQVN